MTAPTAQAALDELPMRLPAASSSARAAAGQPSGWLVGARPGAATARIARAHGARQSKLDTAFELPAARARAFAAELGRAGTLTYAEPNVRMRRSSAFDSTPLGWARTAIVDPGVNPPAPGNAAIAIIDDLVDKAHPDLSHVHQVNPGPVLGPHGTEVASAAAAQFDGSGVFGVFPRAPVLSFGMPLVLECADVSNAIVAAADAGARVINLSFGSPGDCTTMFFAVQFAYAAGSLVVAAAGNEFAAGNPVIYPAAYPHVLSVAAIGPNGQAANFSNENTAVDVAAPGVAVPLATPAAFDADGVVDGRTVGHGTSYSAPMVAGAAAWLATVRSTLSNGQLADVLRRSARDIGPPGYDAGTGFGLVRMAGALTAPTPARDVLEPNDGITFVDGTAFGRPDPFIWRGKGRRRLNGTVDEVEDPVDVYRIRVPRRARFRIRLRPRFGDPDLFVYSGKAKSLGDTRKIVARATRGRGKTDSVRLLNRRRARTLYVAVDVDARSGRTLDAGYQLELRRLKRR
ncbi:MAG: S8 family serine peptidase [Actinomycetota bacterium]|nr:S8 family serine peptidase [Actinomycetota bacterium]